MCPFRCSDGVAQQRLSSKTMSFHDRDNGRNLYCYVLWNRKCDMLLMHLGRRYFDDVFSLRIHGVAW
jgi:hypothetical protein